MLDKRDIKLTWGFVKQDVREIFDACVQLVFDVTFLFDGTTAQAREAFGVNEANFTASIARLEASRNSPSPTKPLLRVVK